jgi:predicted RNA-binding protein with PUA-like domain
MNHWLMKTEPSTFGIDDLERAPKRTTTWEGVRNYQARNMLRDDFAKGDRAFLYHSSCDVPGIVAIMRVARAGYPDPTADEPGEARWYTVDVQLERRLARVITLEELKAHATRKLAKLVLLQRGNRLSVMPVSAAHFEYILTLE